MSTNPESLSAEATFPGSLRFPVAPDVKHLYLRTGRLFGTLNIKPGLTNLIDKIYSITNADQYQLIITNWSILEIDDLV